MEEREEIISQLTEMLKKPGGKQAARFILNSLGAIPFVGGAISASGNLLSETDQQIFNEKFVEWIEYTNADLEKVLNLLQLELKEPNKANLSLLLGEVLGVEIPFMIQVGNVLEVSAILNPQTLSEFEQYQNAGWITITSNGNTMILGTGNKIVNSIEDKKRPWGIGNGFVIGINESLWQKE